MSSKTASPCYCSAYPFPHRVGGGKCYAAPSDDLCECCRKPVEDLIMVDEGIGAYEYWGSTGVHHDWQAVTECCRARPITNRPKGSK